MTRPGGRPDVALAISLLVATTCLMLLDVDSQVRLVAATTFVLVVPGFAFVGLLRLDHAASTLATSVATSLALTTLATQLLVWQHAYTVERAFAILATMSALGLTTQLVQRHRAGPGGHDVLRPAEGAST